MNGDNWLGLEPIVDGRSSLELTPLLVRFDDKLFGGTGIAAVVAAMEAATERHARWATVQFVGSADLGDRLDVEVEVVAHGHTTAQVRFSARVGDRLVLAGLGAAAIDRPDGFGHRFGRMPEVPAPEDAPTFTLGFPTPPPEMRRSGPFSVADFRDASVTGSINAVWVRLDGIPLTRASLAYLADFVPSAVLREAGKLGGGTSLDNTIRFGPAVDDPDRWLLIESVPYFADGGFVHGAARLWTADGMLVGVASQSAVARIFTGFAPDGSLV